MTIEYGWRQPALIPPEKLRLKVTIIVEPSADRRHITGWKLEDLFTDELVAMEAGDLTRDNKWELGEAIERLVDDLIAMYGGPF